MCIVGVSDGYINDIVYVLVLAVVVFDVVRTAGYKHLP